MKKRRLRRTPGHDHSSFYSLRWSIYGRKRRKEIIEARAPRFRAVFFCFVLAWAHIICCEKRFENWGLTWGRLVSDCNGRVLPVQDIPMQGVGRSEASFSSKRAEKLRKSVEHVVVLIPHLTRSSANWFTLRRYDSFIVQKPILEEFRCADTRTSRIIRTSTAWLIHWLEKQSKLRTEEQSKIHPPQGSD